MITSSAKVAELRTGTLQALQDAAKQYGSKNSTVKEGRAQKSSSVVPRQQDFAVAWLTIRAGAGNLKYSQLVDLLVKPGEPCEGKGDCLSWAAQVHLRIVCRFATSMGMVLYRLFGLQDDSGHLAPWKLTRRQPGPEDIFLQVVYCGVCHSDLHQLKNEWGNTSYPVVPG